MKEQLIKKLVALGYTAKGIKAVMSHKYNTYIDIAEAQRWIDENI